jgi:predicted nucleotidyltransferase
MFEIIQSEKDFESVIDSKKTQAEAQEYISALNDTKKNQDTQFYYKESKSYSENESNLF